MNWSKDKAKYFAKICNVANIDKKLTEIQDVLAKIWGHASWKKLSEDMKRNVKPTLVDEDLIKKGNVDFVTSRNNNSIDIVRKEFSIDNEMAANIIKTLQPTAMSIRNKNNISNLFHSQEVIEVEKAVEKKYVKLYVLRWEESERGWGVRPDGYSIHKSVEDSEKYVEEYWERTDKYNKENGIMGVPDEYERPDGEVFSFEILEDDEIVKKLNEKKLNGIRVWRSDRETTKKILDSLYKREDSLKM